MASWSFSFVGETLVSARMRRQHTTRPLAAACRPDVIDCMSLRARRLTGGRGRATRWRSAGAAEVAAIGSLELAGLDHRLHCRPRALPRNSEETFDVADGQALAGRQEQRLLSDHGR